jgi:hypothetical protein
LRNRTTASKLAKLTASKLAKLTASKRAKLTASKLAKLTASKLAKQADRFFVPLQSQVGTVESALVLIPTILLFLSVLQIAASVLGRGVAVNELQGEVSREALLGSISLISSDQYPGIEIDRLSLPGGGEIIVGSKKVAVVKITPLLIFQDQFLVRGIAINEN